MILKTDHTLEYGKGKRFLFLLFAFLCSFRTDAQIAVLTIINPSSLIRTDELVVLTRLELEQHLGVIPSKKYISIETSRPLLVQHDDLNRDGLWDEIVFLYSFRQKESKVFTVRVSLKPPAISDSPRAGALLAKIQPDGSYINVRAVDTMPFNQQPHNFSPDSLPPYLYEGPVWENDRVAFHSYFDVRNVKTILGKEKDSINTNFTSSKGGHLKVNAQLPVIDIVKPGNSLGAGSLGLIVKANDKRDSIITLAGAHIERTIYRSISDGPVRATFKIRYENIQFDNRPLFVEEEISIWGGQYFYASKVIVKGLNNERVLAGIGNLLQSVSYQLKSDNFRILYIHGKEVETGKFLGMGIIAESNNFTAFGNAGLKSAGNSYTVVFNPRASVPVEFRFYAGWQKSDQRFADRIYFENYLKEEAERWANPVKLRWQHNRNMEL